MKPPQVSDHWVGLGGSAEAEHGGDGFVGHQRHRSGPCEVLVGEVEPPALSWWLGLLALLPIACCAGPALLAAGITAGTGAVLGGAAGAVLVMSAAVVALIAVRRRRRNAGRQNTCR